MAASETSISAGLIIGDLLIGDPSISKTVTTLFPVVTDKAKLPYISFRCSRMESVAIKDSKNADTLFCEVNCFAGTYAESVALAEMARKALDGKQAVRGGLVMRSCFFADREEDWQDDAYIQHLVFRIKI